MIKIYESPCKKSDLPDSGWQTPGPPRSFIEWKTLRRWNKLPAGEIDIWGYLLRIIREKRRITQKDLAEKLGITQQAVAQAERWTSNPTLSFLERWCKACSCKFNLENLISSEDEGPGQSRRSE